MANSAMVDKKNPMADFEKLSRTHQKEIIDFVAYLKVKEELEATKEILDSQNFIESIIKGEQDFNKGNFKSWSEVREDV